MHALDPALAPEAILDHHGSLVRDLLVARDVLFAGSWDDLAEDLRRRVAGRPYLFRLADHESGEDALAWIARLQAYETARGEIITTA
jgi:hypothetical protein